MATYRVVDPPLPLLVYCAVEESVDAPVSVQKKPKAEAEAKLPEVKAARDEAAAGLQKLDEGIAAEVYADFREATKDLYDFAE